MNRYEQDNLWMALGIQQGLRAGVNHARSLPIAEERFMSDEEYESTQAQLMLMGQLLLGLDLEGFLQRINRVEVIDPVLNPTRHREAMDNLGDIKTAAEVLRAAQRKLAGLSIYALTNGPK